MRTLKQSTAYDLSVFMTDSADHVTGKTGLTLTITASKAGAAFASISPTVTERGSGWYSAALTTAHTDTLGDLAIHITATGADPADLAVQIRANVLGDTLPASIQSVAAGAITAAAFAANALDAVWSAATRLLTAGTNIVLAKGTGVTGFTDLDASGVRAAVGLGSANLDTQLDALPTNAELATALGTADDAVLAQVALVKAKTDLIPADPATETTLATLASVSDLASLADYIATHVEADVEAIKAKTDALPASPAATGDIPTADSVAAAVFSLVDAIESGVTLQDFCRKVLAACAGLSNGFERGVPGTGHFRDPADTKNRITVTYDANGNRTGITFDLS